MDGIRIGNLIDPLDLLTELWKGVLLTLSILGWQEESVVLIDNSRDKWFVEEVLWPDFAKKGISILNGEPSSYEDVMIVSINNKEFKGIIIHPDDWDSFIEKALKLPRVYPGSIVSKELKEDHFDGKEEEEDV